jgi:hypothetical protein
LQYNNFVEDEITLIFDRTVKLDLGLRVQTQFNTKIGLQVSLTIRGGYIPEKSQTVNNKTGILGSNWAISGSK